MTSVVAAQIEKAALERIMAGLDDNVPARKTPLSAEELPLVRGLQLLTMKPVRWGLLDAGFHHRFKPRLV